MGSRLKTDADGHRELSRRSARAARFNLNPPIEVLTRPYGMRFYTFSMEAHNISQTGFLLVAKSSGFIPYTVASQVHITVDMHARVFARPLHMVLTIVRVEELDGRQSFGCAIKEILEGHSQIFFEGLSTLGDKDAVQT